MYLVILNHGHETRTTPELAAPTSIYQTKGRTYGRMVDVVSIESWVRILMPPNTLHVERLIQPKSVIDQTPHVAVWKLGQWDANLRSSSSLDRS
ncbi:hypothetical protein TNCV_2325731 [Trichonephila clavipes]|nr:hypothetical protein TNCV_2325731 [Trichonephila clavipes]